jgi:hypothetical protein
MLDEALDEYFEIARQNSFTELVTTETGWIYKSDDSPYPLYRQRPALIGGPRYVGRGSLLARVWFLP